MSEPNSDEDDDYVPPANDDEENARESKRAHIEVQTTTEEERAVEKNNRNALWDEFKSGSTSKPAAAPEKMIAVQKKYIFAGEEVTEIVEVPEGSAEPAATSTKPSQPVKRPGPRRSKVKLGDIPSASASKPKKLSTLDKSVMDWKSHLQEATPEVKDELSANRRGGGYLEKVDFLERVKDRKEEIFDAAKSTKRRRT